MIEERTEERRINYNRALKENRRHCLVMWPPTIRHPSATLDNKGTSIEDIEWVIAHHQKQIKLATQELARRVQLERKRWTNSKA